MSTALITRERAIAAGQLIQQGQTGLAEVDNIRRLHGDTTASLYRVAALDEFRKSLMQDDVQALIISAADHSYECAESEKFKFSPEMKFKGAVMAMMKGCLLSDEAGPHFTLICGKGGMNVLIKEPGLRHKMKRKGVRNIDVAAVARMVRPRPNASGKFDMIIDGHASCELNGEVFTVERKGEFPIILPCYESDGPDGHEAKARRRLLRDLWAKVSGEFDPIEMDEIDDPSGEVIESAAVAKIDNKAAAVQPDNLTDRERQALAFEQTYDGIQRRVKDAEQLARINDAWHAIKIATDKETLRQMYKTVEGWVKSLGKNNVDELLRWCRFCADGLPDDQS